MKQRVSLFLVLAALAVVGAVWSMLLIVAQKQQTLDQRVQSVATQLKCVVCQGESVADSQADLAQQMRLVIRDQLRQGKSEQDVIQYFAQRYGEQIVWSPPWQGFSLLIWLVPLGFLLGGGALIVFLLREWRSAAADRVRTRTAESTKHEPQTVAVETGEPDLERYRERLEAELAAEDALFRRPGLEAT